MTMLLISPRGKKLAVGSKTFTGRIPSDKERRQLCSSEGLETGDNTKTTYSLDVGNPKDELRPGERESQEQEAHIHPSWAVHTA